MVHHRDILVSDDVVLDATKVRASLARRVDEILARGGDGRDELHVMRLVVHIAPMDPFAWLAAQDIHPKIYWHGRHDDVITAAVGHADEVFGGPNADYDSLRAQLDVVLPRSDARVRYYGGFRFDLHAASADEWSDFGTFNFTLPRFVYMQREDRAVLACNLLLPRDVDRGSQILREVERLRFPIETLPTELPLPTGRADEPGEDAWDENVRWAVDAFHDDENVLEKIVLARRAAFDFAEPVDPLALLKKLEAETSNCFHFGFQFSADTAFVGATPERLFRRSGRRIWTEAVAGTRPRGATPVEDRAAIQSLMDSEKDQREHAYVRDSIREALEPLCTDFDIDQEASELKLARGWHLVSRSRGLLRDGVHGSDVMRALHPTPAVGGYPTVEALSAIREREHFDRGWYAGPVGWIGSHGAEFAVALRCGLIHGNALSLYSGAGIVDGSDPNAEWAEIEQKISDFVKVFGLRQRDIRSNGRS